MGDIVQDPRETQLDVWYLERVIKKYKLVKLRNRPGIYDFHSTQHFYLVNLFQTMTIQLRLYFQFNIRRNYSGQINLPIKWQGKKMT